MVLSLKKVLLALAALFAFAPLYAKTPVVTVSAPNMVAEGEVFRLEISVDAKPDEFVPPAIPADCFDVLAGPSVQSGHSFVVNGNDIKQEVTHSRIYVISAKKTGLLTIPRAGYMVDGKTYWSDDIDIEVADASAAQQQGTVPGMANADVKLVAQVDKTNVFVGQPIKVSFKLYWNTQVQSAEALAVPSFSGFWAGDVTAPDYPVRRETLGGKIYESKVLGEYVIYPMAAGRFSIEPLSFNVFIRVVTQARRQSLLDEFFGGGSNVEILERRVSSEPVAISVRELPAGAPDGFSGAVGRFTMETGVSGNIVSANSAATYFVKVSGAGNLPLITSPTVNLPASFELYPAKTTDNFSTTLSGVRGERLFEYPFIARSDGAFTVEPQTFTYFDPEQVRYVTLTSDRVMLDISPDTSGAGRSGGVVSGINKSEVEMLGEDIRFIKLGRAGLSPAGTMFMGGTLYWLIVAGLVVLFFVLLAWLRKYIADSRNTVAVRGRRANKVALQRLNAAARYMKEDNRRGFYEEMLRALWGYMSDRLNIPVSDLTKDNVREELHKRSVATEQTERFVGIISDCEQAQYSPDSEGHMHEIYNTAVSSISKIETVIRRKRS